MHVLVKVGLAMLAVVGAVLAVVVATAAVNAPSPEPGGADPVVISPSASDPTDAAERQGQDERHSGKQGSGKEEVGGSAKEPAARGDDDDDDHGDDDGDDDRFEHTNPEPRDLDDDHGEDDRGDDD